MPTLPILRSFMLQSNLARWLLAPLALLYGGGVSLRNWFYRRGLLKSIRFDVPVISVGNLSVGGAGKTPHIEYLIRLLHEYVNVATLSRGYGRQTRGFQEVHPRLDARAVGDEPLQFKRKFPDIRVTVAEDRAFAIPTIMGQWADTQVILLDDAFQHRAVQPGLNVLLTQYQLPYTRDWLLPSGRLREWRSAYQRADVVIVTKCPVDLDRTAADTLAAELKLLPHQQLYFSYYEYGAPYYMLDPRYRLKLDSDLEILLISAIANTDYLMEYLEEKAGAVRSIEYADHHYFTSYDVSTLDRTYHNLVGPRKVIITTEKDAMRLEMHRDYLLAQRLPIFVLPAEVAFHFGGGPVFDEAVRQFLLNFKV